MQPTSVTPNPTTDGTHEEDISVHRQLTFGPPSPSSEHKGKKDRTEHLPWQETPESSLAAPYSPPLPGQQHEYEGGKDCKFTPRDLSDNSNNKKVVDAKTKGDVPTPMWQSLRIPPEESLELGPVELGSQLLLAPLPGRWHQSHDEKREMDGWVNGG